MLIAIEINHKINYVTSINITSDSEFLDKKERFIKIII
jgi:hypothetical protein